MLAGMGGVLVGPLLLGALGSDGVGPSQLLVMGPHHSATSITAASLRLLGLYLGEERDLLVDRSNPLKFWERRDVVEINRQRLREGAGVSHLASSDSVPPFVGLGFDSSSAAQKRLNGKKQDVIAQLNAHRPWATKDPRLSLLAHEWLPLLDANAVCVLTVRHPLDFANSMMRFSSGLSMRDWVDVWYHYMGQALSSCSKQPLALVLHSSLVRSPLSAMEALHSRLSQLGVLLPPFNPRLALSLNLSSPPPEPSFLPSEVADATSALELFHTLVKAANATSTDIGVHGSTPPWPVAMGLGADYGAGLGLVREGVPNWPSVASRVHQSSEAYVTLLTTSDRRYLAGALALASSIRGMDTSRDMLALIVPSVPADWHDELTSVGWKLHLLEPLDEFWWDKHPQCTTFTRDQAARWGTMATKLRLWQLTTYSTLLYMDADSLLLADPAPLFRVNAFAAEAGVAHKAFNAGVMLVKPSTQVFEELLRLAASSGPPNIFRSPVDCTEQALLNLYFLYSNRHDSAHKVVLFPAEHPFHAPPHALLPRSVDKAPPILHWITLKCPKPWDLRANATAALPADCNASNYQLWWRMYNRTGRDVLSAVRPPSRLNHRRASEYSGANEYDGCSQLCPNDWVGDGFCDLSCNVEACNWDGNDCFYQASECWSEPDGKDYRGKVAQTKSGVRCQVWSEQTPWHHIKTTLSYPEAGLGGHNFCRNPDGEAGPWCYTLDYPNTRWDFCDVGLRSQDCKKGNASSTMAGGAAASSATETEITLGKFVDDFVSELELEYYTLPVSPSVTGLKIVLIPINGDADLFISFDRPKPERRTATWIEDSIGVKQFTLLRSNSYFCPTEPCALHLAVSGFEDGDYKLVVYNYSSSPLSSTDIAAAGAAAAAYSCSPGCDEMRLGNLICDKACNTSECVWDQGDCGYSGEYELEQLCSSGCPLSWVDDGYCDDACFNSACSWDAHDCIEGDAGCNDGCLPSFLDDSECDEVCHTASCGWDGTDCGHGTDDCYTMADGQDYRGSVSTTKSGHSCQLWSHQSPNAHTHTHINYPNAGLGGHNFCRNPGGSDASPWCYTLGPVRLELCNVPPPQTNCSIKDSTYPYHYHTMCPVDCATLLGNGICETRCNISSCAYDRGDCGVGLSLSFVAAGYVPKSNVYLLLGIGVAIGVSLGLLVLRYVLRKLMIDEEKRRGYSLRDMKSNATHDEDDI